MLLTIDIFGTSIPFYDEWEAEALWLYTRYVEGNFNIVDFFEPHNGHRIVLTRITALLVFIINEGWDPELQLIVNSVLHAAVAVVLVKIVLREVRFEHKYWAVVFTIILFAIPFSSLSILVAFQTQFYYMILFSVLSISLLSVERYLSGYIFALLAMLSMTSGAFVLLAFLITLSIESFRTRRVSYHQLLQIGVCILIFGLFLVTRPTDSSSPLYYAQHIKGFVITILATISWPFRVSYGIGLVIYIPAGLLLLRAIFMARIPRVYLFFTLFVALQILAMGYFRGGDGVPPANRYWEILILGIWLNGMAVLYLLNTATKYFMKLAIVWLFVMAVGMASLAYQSISIDLPERKDQSLTAQVLIVEFLSNGDPKIFDERSALHISHSNRTELQSILSMPLIRKILPSALEGDSEDSLDSFKVFLMKAKWVLGIVGLLLLVIVHKSNKGHNVSA